MKKNSSQATT
jgi:hypothetical protein